MNKCIVRVIEARGIRAADINGKSDPYVMLSIKGSGQMTQRTRTLYKTLSPIWNEEFTFQNIRPNDVLEVRLWDYDSVGNDDYLGQLDIPLQSYMNNARDEWKPILERKRGLKSHLTSALTGMNNLHSGAGEIHLGIFVQGSGNASLQQPMGNTMNQPMQYQNQPPQYGANNNYPNAAPSATNSHPGQYPQNTYGQNTPGIINYPNQQNSTQQPPMNYGQPSQNTGQYPQNTYGSQNVPGILPFNQQQGNSAAPAYPQNNNYPATNPPYSGASQNNYAAPSTNYPVPTSNYPAPQMNNYPAPQQQQQFNQPFMKKEASSQFPNSWGPGPAPINYGAM